MKTRLYERNQRLLFGGLVGLSGLVATLALLLFKLTVRHGDTLLQLEELQAATTSQPEPPPQPGPAPRESLFEQGMPPGSVGMNFELNDLDGKSYTLTPFLGRRVLLVFVSPTCPYSLSLLPMLSRLPSGPEPGSPVILLVSSDDRELNRRVMAEQHVRLPVLVQERNEVSLLYYVNGTPQAYLLDAAGVTELPRINGPQAILGVIFAVSQGDGTPPPRDDAVTAADRSGSPPLTPLRPGDPVPPLQIPLLSGELLTHEPLRGRQTILTFFDPLCAPCLELLPELARIQRDADQPDVLLITRRDPELTRQLIGQHDMPYPIAVQTHWEVSRRFGVLSAPAACLIGPELWLESDLVVGRAALETFLGSFRGRRDHPARQLVSIRSMLEP